MQVFYLFGYNYQNFINEGSAKTLRERDILLFELFQVYDPDTLRFFLGTLSCDYIENSWYAQGIEIANWLPVFWNVNFEKEEWKLRSF